MRNENGHNFVMAYPRKVVNPSFFRANDRYEDSILLPSLNILEYLSWNFSL